MARLWEDGFDHYGSDTNNMLDNSYATCGSNISLSTTHPATGTHGILVNGTNNVTNTQCLRKVLPTAIDKIGCTGRFWFASLPAGNTGGTIFDFLSSDTRRPQISCVIDSSGAMRFIRGRNYNTLSGENGTLVAQTDPLISAGANNHIEVQVYIHSSAGWVRVAVNGVHQYQATGLNTQFDTTKIASVSQAQGISGDSGSGGFYMDDYIIYDFNGTAATDTDFCCTVDGSGIATNYIGELFVWPLFANGDTAEDDWQKSTGSSASALIDEADPNDADYIYSTTAGDLTEVDLEDLPPEITYIRGLSIHGRMSKSDSGIAMTKQGMKSVAATTDAAERSITVDPAYWRDMVNVDPNSGARWTRASLNAAWLRLTRSV